MRFKLSPAALRYFLWGSIAAALLLLSTRVFGEPPRAVSLLYFRGSGLDQAVSLEWATASELNTAGYRLERADTSEGPFQNLSQLGIVPARGDSLQGSEYSATDRDSVQNGRVYWYKLIEIEFDGTENPVGPISVTAGLSEPTATTASESTSQATATTAGSGPNTATQTPSPSASRNTPAPGSSPTATPLGTASGLTTSSAARTALTTPSPQGQAVAALAQADTPLPGTAYPGAPGGTLVPPLGVPATDPAYPPPGLDTTEVPTVAYPPLFESEDRGNTEQQPLTIPTGTLAALIGDPPGATPVQETESVPESAATPSSSLLLWTGFLLALMIFILAVVGSIIYFRR